MLVGVLTALAVIVLDQASKVLVYTWLNENDPVVAVTPFFNLVAAWNTGVSFSMFNNMGEAGVYILSAFSLLVVGFLLYWLKNEKSVYNQVALGFVIGGAVGNVIDRIRLSAVFDFLDFHLSGHHWPAFNLADSFICLGAAMIICEGVFLQHRPDVKTSNKG